MWKLLRADLEAALQSYATTNSTAVPRAGLLIFFAFTKLGLQAVFAYRISFWLSRHRVPVLPSLVSAWSERRTRCDISPTARIGPGFVIMHSSGIVIHGAVIAGHDLRLYSGVVLGNRAGSSRLTPPCLGNGVTVGTGAKVLGPITIGHFAAIGANAVVIKDVPSYHRAVGVPAVVMPLATVPR